MCETCNEIHERPIAYVDQSVKVATKSSEVEEELTKLSVSIEELYDTLNVLQVRLAPVSKDVEECSEDVAADLSPNTQIARSIKSSRIQIYYASENVKKMISNLGI